MSQWTHVAGLIRLDSMGAVIVRLTIEEMNKRLKEAAAKALGNTCDFESPSDAWDLCTVPPGMEAFITSGTIPFPEHVCFGEWFYAFKVITK